MSTGRENAVYFGLLLVACAIGYFVANRSSDFDGDGGDIPDFAGFGEPELNLEPAFEFPYPMPKFETRISPTLVVSDDVESMLLEVRSALLTSATPIEVSRIEELAAVTD